MMFFFPRLWVFGAEDSGTRRSDARVQAEPVADNSPDLDRMLAERLRAADVGALERLVRMHANTLEAHAYSVVQSDQLAQDIVQDVFIRVWEQRAKFQLRGGWSAYLHRAVHYAAVSALRHELAERRAGNVYGGATATSVVNAGPRTIEGAELDRVIRTEIDALPPRCREIFLLNRQGGLSYARIAQVLQIAPQTVANQMHRALDRLAEAVRRWEQGE